ncbi:MAG: hypothetical protein WBQ73_03720 [Candidatus Babeliales bacterium]
MTTRPSLFGTDGIRGVMGTSPLTKSDLIALGLAIAEWAARYCIQHNNTHFLIGTDTRSSSSFIVSHLTQGLAQSSLPVCTVGVISTPALFWLTAQRPGTIGIMITASHNPAHFNGIKIMTHAQGKLSALDESYISQMFLKYKKQVSPFSLSNNSSYQNTQLVQKYLNYLLSRFSHLNLSPYTIVLDCAHGATSHLAPALFKDLGANIIPLHITPTGTNINEHSGTECTTLLQKAVIQHKADIGFAFDGDGDRLVVINNQGERKDGDALLAFLTNNPHYTHLPSIVGTIMSNSALDLFLATKKIRLLRTFVSDKHVLSTLKKHHLLLGGEPSGHLILRNYHDTTDGLLTSLVVLETLRLTSHWSLNSFTPYPTTLIAVPLSHVSKKVNPATFDMHCQTIITKFSSQVTPGRILIRRSGTEPIIRVLVEGTDLQLTNLVAQRIVAQLTQLKL